MKRTNINADEALGIGTDHTFPLTVLTADESAAVDITGWALSFVVKRRVTDPDGDALIAKTTGAGVVISGTYNATPDDNTQVATATVDDTDTADLVPGLCWYEWKRTDAGFGTTLAQGTLPLVRRVHAS